MAGLGQRRVEHALRPELVLQPVGDPEHAAQLADVLAQHQRPRILAPASRRSASFSALTMVTSAIGRRPRLGDAPRRAAGPGAAGARANTHSNISSTGRGSDAMTPARSRAANVSRLVLHRRRRTPSSGDAAGRRASSRYRSIGSRAFHASTSVRRPVPRRVVGRRVRAHPVRDRLDQRGDALRPGPARPPRAWPGTPRARRCRPPARRGSRTPRPCVQIGATVCCRHRHGDRPLVVLAEEHHRRAEHARRSCSPRGSRPRRWRRRRSRPACSARRRPSFAPMA